MALPLLLALALGQAGPPAAPAEATPPAPPAAPAVATPAASPAAPMAAPRDVTVVRRPDGGFDATLAGEPVAGADFYRAVLRPDLADRYDRASDRKAALLVAAVAAPLLGLTAGWIYAKVNYHPPPSCSTIVPQPPDCQLLAQENAQWNQQHLQQGLVVGAASGLAVGLVFGWLSWRVELPAPTTEEAEGLARRYREQHGLPASPPGATPPGAGTLRLEPTAGGMRLSLSGRF